MSDRHISEAYLPASGEPEVIDIVPGTHASGNLLAYLAFNRFVLDPPLYRESYCILDEKMCVSRMTLTNWLAKGFVFVSRLVDVLKEKCLDKDAVVICDETWCRVKVEDTYRKRYILCMAYARAKFKYAFEQSDDKDAGYTPWLRGRAIWLGT